MDLRAGTYHPPSLEMMAPYGVTDEMHKTAIKVPRWQIRDRREGVIVEWDMSEIGDLTPYPYRLHLEQHRLTPIILAKLRDYPNAEVRFSHKVIDADQTADEVTVNGETPGGTEIFQAAVAGGRRRRPQHRAQVHRRGLRRIHLGRALRGREHDLRLCAARLHPERLPRGPRGMGGACSRCPTRGRPGSGA